MTTKDLKVCSFRLEPSKLSEFKAFCTRNKITIRDSLTKVINLLLEADKLIHNDRAKAYGSFTDNMGKVSSLFSAMTGKQLTKKECAWFLICLKLARESSKHKRDNLVDATGYIALLDEMNEDE